MALSLWTVCDVKPRWERTWTDKDSIARNSADTCYRMRSLIDKGLVLFTFTDLRSEEGERK